MRTPKYLSPTSVALWILDREAFYKKYLSDNPPIKEPQTPAMAVGSSFDAHVKSYLSETLFGRRDPKFEFQNLFESQVEIQNRDAALLAGEECFREYEQSGALVDLAIELENAHSEPQMEYDVQGTIGGIPILGKPDLYYKTQNGRLVILDWKVNGYYSKSGVSPKPGYIVLRNMGMREVHKKAQIMRVDGIMINVAGYLETIEETWANQLSAYAWVINKSVNEDFICGIEQLVCKPIIRVASHRSKVGKIHQQQLFRRFQECWDAIISRHIFKDMSPEESKARCDIIDRSQIIDPDFTRCL